MATPKANVIKALVAMPNKSDLPCKTPSNAGRTFSFSNDQKPGVESDDSDKQE